MIRIPQAGSRGPVAGAVLLAILVMYGCGSAQRQTHSRHASAARGTHVHHQARRRPRPRPVRRPERQPVRRHHHHHGAPQAVAGIVVSHCRWQSGSGCPALPSARRCHLRGPLQDPNCTPGALNPAVTQSNIGATICVSGYTDRIRPPTSYTEPLKYRLMDAYGFGARSASDFELDHLISLELGGAPSDPRNLFPEPYAGSRGAYAKDRLENSLHDQVCSGAMSLAAAQHEILDWARYAGPTGGSHSKRQGSPSSAPAGQAHASRCDPNYSGACLDPKASDYDCAGGGGDGPRYVQGPVRVVGTDHFHLDSNGDGVGCE